MTKAEFYTHLLIFKIVLLFFDFFSIFKKTVLGEFYTCILSNMIMYTPLLPMSPLTHPPPNFMSSFSFSSSCSSF